MFILQTKTRRHITTEEDSRTASKLRRISRSVPACNDMTGEGMYYVKRICRTEAL